VTTPWSNISEMKRICPYSNIWSHQQTVKHLKITAYPIPFEKKENNFKKNFAHT
jgi:hypothetical protein